MDSKDELALQELLSLLDAIEELESMFEEQTIPGLLVVSDAEQVLDVQFTEGISLSLTDIVDVVVPMTYDWLSVNFPEYSEVQLHFAHQGKRGMIIGAHVR